eukprot:Pompholyxophrys_punicea_v1_NODE_26_length_5204_cov_9.403379.p1 type:complete len:152 gc:universal NODE_26_length_5204_cov_9.403379:4391-3936(-)
MKWHHVKNVATRKKTWHHLDGATPRANSLRGSTSKCGATWHHPFPIFRCPPSVYIEIYRCVSTHRCQFFCQKIFQAAQNFFSVYIDVFLFLCMLNEMSPRENTFNLLESLNLKDLAGVLFEQKQFFLIYFCIVWLQLFLRFPTVEKKEFGG